MHHVLLHILKTGIVTGETPRLTEDLAQQAELLARKGFGRFGHTLSIRHVDAGSCNGCEAEISMMSGPCYMLEHLGFRFVASPRHADLLLVTGPVSRHMKEALLATWEAMPHPKIVVSTGDCALDGGLFKSSYAVEGGVSSVIPVDVHIPGCPPDPESLIRGLLTAVGG